MSTPHDALRWGDQTTLTFVPSNDQEIVVSPSQLVQAHWHRPTVWNVLLLAVPIPSNPAESADYTVRFNVTLGAGQATMTFFVQSDIPNNTPYIPLVDQRFWPGQDIQITAQASTENQDFPGVVQVGAFVAPYAEAGDIHELLERLRGTHPDAQTRWMPAGFNPESLGYR